MPLRSKLFEKYLSRRLLLKFGAGSVSLLWWVLGGCRRPDASAGPQPATPSPEQPEVVQPLTEGLQTQDVLRIAFANPPSQLDPAVMTLNSSFHVSMLVYDGLVWVDQELIPQPALAEEWEASTDLLSWTFTLRQGVIFHHGSQFTAEDVVYSFERLLDPTIGSQLRSVLSFVSAVEAVDDGSEAGAVRFVLNSANADLPLLLGTPQARIVPHDYDQPLLVSAPSGTGPYRLTEINLDEHFVFERNDDYWARESLLLAQVRHIYISTFEEQVAAMAAGDIDLIPDVGLAQAEQLSGEADIEVLETTSGAYQTVVMQATEEPFTDLRVRQALKACLDRSQMQESVLLGHGERGFDHPVASISPYYADMAAHGPDIEEARRLLIDAGYPEGLKLDLITAALDPGMVEVAQAVRELAAPAGFEIEPIQVPADIYWTSYWTQVPFHVGSWNFRPSIDETFSIAYHSQSVWNEGKWAHPDLDNLIDTARSEPDQEQRKELYRQAQELIMQEGAVVIPYFRPMLVAIRRHVQGFVPHPAGWLDMRGVKVDNLGG